VGLTQTQLAQAVGVTFQQLQKYEGAVNRTYLLARFISLR
jgi:transcriptional regulator with XRE-family HTH domain